MAHIRLLLILTENQTMRATSRLRLMAGAIISPLRHPLTLAKELATLDRLSVFTSTGRPADLDQALATIPAQVARVAALT